MNEKTCATFIDTYGQRVFDHIQQSLRDEDYDAVIAFLAYTVEMAQEVLYSNKNDVPLGTALYGFDHNRGISTLDSNYMVPHEIYMRDSLTYEGILERVVGFIPSVRGGFRSPVIACLVPVIRHLHSVVSDVVESGILTGPVREGNVASFLEAHNSMVKAHLDFREQQEDFDISEYQSFEEIKETKNRVILRQLSETPQGKVFAAFVYLKEQGGRFSREDVAQLANVTPYEVGVHVGWLCDTGLLLREPGQNYYNTQVVLKGLSAQEAYNMLESPSTGFEDLTWREALLYTALRDRAGTGAVRIDGTQLALAAFYGYYTSSGSVTTGALSSLERRGLIERDTSTIPFTYRVLEHRDSDSVFRSVRAEDVQQLEEILSMEPVSIDAEYLPVEKTTEDVQSQEALVQEEANNKLTALMDNIIHQRLAHLNPDLVELVLSQGTLSHSHDEATGTTKITFSYQGQ